MSRNRPVKTEDGSVVPLRYRAQSPTVAGSSRRPVGSPLGEAILAAAPEVLRAFGRATESAGEGRGQHGGAPLPAAGYTVSQVELDLVGPAVRRVVVRTASAWSTTPASPERPESRRRGRLVVGLLGLGGLIVGLAAARRVPGRSRPAGRVTPW